MKNLLLLASIGLMTLSGVAKGEIFYQITDQVIRGDLPNKYGEIITTPGASYMLINLTITNNGTTEQTIGEYGDTNETFHITSNSGYTFKADDSIDDAVSNRFSSSEKLEPLVPHKFTLVFIIPKSLASQSWIFTTPHKTSCSIGVVRIGTAEFKSK